VEPPPEYRYLLNSVDEDSEDEEERPEAMLVAEQRLRLRFVDFSKKS
jgi:hypothetical protein